jgi:hypothetical protein
MPAAELPPLPLRFSLHYRNGLSVTVFPPRTWPSSLTTYRAPAIQLPDGA